MSELGRGRNIMRGISLVVAGVLLLSAQPGVAVTGNEWQGLPESSKKFYVAGVVDTWTNLAGLTHFIKKTHPQYEPSEAERHYLDITACVEKRGLSYGQIADVVENYMANNPAQWDRTMVSNVRTALYQICKR